MTYNFHTHRADRRLITRNYDSHTELTAFDLLWWECIDMKSIWTYDLCNFNDPAYTACGPGGPNAAILILQYNSPFSYQHLSIVDPIVQKRREAMILVRLEL